MHCVPGWSKLTIDDQTVYTCMSTKSNSTRLLLPWIPYSPQQIPPGYCYPGYHIHHNKFHQVTVTLDTIFTTTTTRVKNVLETRTTQSVQLLPVKTVLCTPPPHQDLPLWTTVSATVCFKCRMSLVMGQFLV